MLDAVFREHGARLRASLIRLTRDFDLAEDALQDALADAATKWAESPPEDPAGWLLQAARHKAIDRIRRRELDRKKTSELLIVDEVSEPIDLDMVAVEDDTLRLLFTCCHPALPLEGQVALTLRVVAGLTTEEIARAFLVTEDAMAQRILRTKQKIQGAGIPYRVPDDVELPERIEALLAVVYLVFTEGYAAMSGETLVRADLCAEAIRLGRLLREVLPARSECTGLLALMLLTHARRDARVDANGDVVLLEEQDRSRWDHEAITEGLALLDEQAQRRAVDGYTLQAAIAGMHASAKTAGDTDWRGIVALYDRLALIDGSPVIALNRAAAIGMRDGAQAGLEAVDALAGTLSDYELFHSARAHFLTQLGKIDDATVAYDEAIARTKQPAERRFLEKRRAIVRQRRRAPPA